MRISLISIVGALALGLAGCNSNSLQNNLDLARQAYDSGVLTPMANYRALGNGHGNKLGYCAAGTVATLALPCADKATVAKLRSENAAVITAFNNWQAQINAGNTTGAQAAFDALQTAVATVTQLVGTLIIPSK